MLSNEEMDIIFNYLSFARIKTYKNHASNKKDILDLYQWNAKISSALLPSLHICEVVLRNVISKAIMEQYGKEWAWKEEFQKTLPKKKKYELIKQSGAEDKRGKERRTGKVIAELSLSFWQTIFTMRYGKNSPGKPIWNNNNIKLFFPNLIISGDVNLIIKNLHEDIDRIRLLRNRIAHYEPIFTKDLKQEYVVILNIIGYISLDVMDWVKNNNKELDDLLERKP